MPNVIQSPSKGRIVLFRQNKIGAEEWPAIITKVHSDSCVDMAVFDTDDIDASGPLRHTSVNYKEIDEKMADGESAWRWPPRV